MAGFLNVIPLASGTSYPGVAPSIDFGGDGDYALDLNTNTLYGPKDANASTVWPTGPRFTAQPYWLGAWIAWVPGTFTTGQVVDDGSGQYYICVKPHTFTNVTGVGSWSVGDGYIDSSVSPTQYCRCIQDTSVDPMSTLDPTYGNYWFRGNASAFLLADSTGTAGAQKNWQALSPTISVDTSALGPTNFIVANTSITDAKLNTTGVTAGTYPKVTVTNKGRVTAGSSLSSSDLPSHTHNASDINAGTLAIARIPTGTTSSTVALGNAAPNAHGASHGLLGGDPISIDAGYQITTGTLSNARLSGIGYGQLSVAATSGTNVSSSNAVVDGVGVFAIKSFSSSTSVAVTDHALYTTTSGLTLTLHSALTATIPAGRHVWIKNNSAGTLTVKTASGEFINSTNYSVTGFTLAMGLSLHLVSTGAASAGANNWITL